MRSASRRLSGRCSYFRQRLTDSDRDYLYDVFRTVA
jgi:hypothetical protein